MNLGWPTFHITAVSHLICPKQKIKHMAKMEDQNISEINLYYHITQVRGYLNIIVLSLLQLRVLCDNSFVQDWLSQPFFKWVQEAADLITHQWNHTRSIRKNIYQNTFYKLQDASGSSCTNLFKKWSRESTAQLISIIKPMHLTQSRH